MMIDKVVARYGNFSEICTQVAMHIYNIYMDMKCMVTVGMTESPGRGSTQSFLLIYDEPTHLT